VHCASHAKVLFYIQEVRAYIAHALERAKEYGKDAAWKTKTTMFSALMQFLIGNHAETPYCADAFDARLQQ
jgi:hypothetical protein